jgi:DNA-binding CsgD family transcriptional regulator
VDKQSRDRLAWRIGRPAYLSFIACELRDHAKLHFARKVVGGSATTYEVSVLDRVGRRVDLVVSSAPLRERGEIVGTFEVAVPSHQRNPTAPADNPLTPRQTEVLLLLARGFSTEAIARSLSVADETARNHIRAVLRRLDAHTRLEAVAEGRRRGLVQDLR